MPERGQWIAGRARLHCPASGIGPRRLCSGRADRRDAGEQRTQPTAPRTQALS